MAYTPVPTVADGDAAYTAEFINTYIRDNWLAGLPDKFTAAGQIAYASAADTAAVLNVGTVGYNLKVSSGLPAWGVHPTKDIVTTKGDLLVATAADTLARVGVGGNSSALIADDTTSSGTRWRNNASVVAASQAVAFFTTPQAHTFVESIDVASAWSSSTTFTVPVTGYYLFSASNIEATGDVSVDTGDRIYIDVYNVTTATVLCILAEFFMMNNWAAVTAEYKPSTGNGSTILYLTAGNTVQVRVCSPNTGALDSSPANGGVLSIVKLGV